jgi:hypothetical protein
MSLTAFDVGQMAGAAVLVPALETALILGGAWLFDKVLKNHLQDYALAFVSALPVALLLLLSRLNNLAHHPAGDPGRTLALIGACGTILALVVAFAWRVTDVDEKGEKNG